MVDECILVDDKPRARVPKMGNWGKFVRGRIEDVEGHDWLTNATWKRRRETKLSNERWGHTIPCHGFGSVSTHETPKIYRKYSKLNLLRRLQGYITL